VHLAAADLVEGLRLEEEETAGKAKAAVEIPRDLGILDLLVGKKIPTCTQAGGLTVPTRKTISNKGLVTDRPHAIPQAQWIQDLPHSPVGVQEVTLPCILLDLVTTIPTNLLPRPDKHRTKTQI
jgi:hypothetical protein